MACQTKYSVCSLVRTSHRHAVISGSWYSERITDLRPDLISVWSDTWHWHQDNNLSLQRVSPWEQSDSGPSLHASFSLVTICAKYGSPFSPKFSLSSLDFHKAAVYYGFRPNSYVQNLMYLTNDVLEVWMYSIQLSSAAHDLGLESVFAHLRIEAYAVWVIWASRMLYYEYWVIGLEMCWLLISI